MILGVIVAFTAGLLVWMAAWAFGVKAIDAFLVTIAITLAAVTARTVMPFVKEQLGRE